MAEARQAVGFRIGKFTYVDRINCKMFLTGQVSMADYLSNCNMVGGPLRNEVGACLGDLHDMICSDDRVCPGGCSSCAGDRCNNVAETGCTMASYETETATVPGSFQCQTVMTARVNNEINYFTFAKDAWLCNGSQSGERACANVVAAKNMHIQSCQTGTQKL